MAKPIVNTYRGYHLRAIGDHFDAIEATTYTRLGTYNTVPQGMRDIDRFLDRVDVPDSKHEDWQQRYE